MIELEVIAREGHDHVIAIVVPRDGLVGQSFGKRALKKAHANPELHLHDLRHTGGTLAAQTGATLKEVMSRIGHGSIRAAMIYQHAASDRDRKIAEALNLMIEEARTAGESAVG